MAELIPEVMFRSDDCSDDLEVAQFNFELMDVLGDLAPRSKAYMERAKAFHREVAGRRKGQRPSTL
jgi:hypothetical protein